MGVLECASGASAWRGYDYYTEKRVSDLVEIEPKVWKSTVTGSKKYDIHLDVTHPRWSKCNCPHADGKKIICKHIVATYFTVYPQEAEKFYARALAAEKEEEEYQAAIYDRIVKCVHSMKKEELCQLVLCLLYEVPDWVLNRFIRDNDLD